jgi:hypothetical protein
MILALNTFFLSTVSRDANYILKGNSVSPLTRAPRAAWCERVEGVRRHECAGWWVAKEQTEEWKHGACGVSA